MTLESRGSLLAMLEYQSVSAVVDALQVLGASSSTRLSPFESARHLWLLQQGSPHPGSRAAPLGTQLWWSSQSLGPILFTVAAPAGEQKCQSLLLSHCCGGHTAPSLMLPWSEQHACPGLQETWQGCKPARWENAAAAGRW